MTGHFLYTITIYKSKKQLIIQKSMAPKLRGKNLVLPSGTLLLNTPL